MIALILILTISVLANALCVGLLIKEKKKLALFKGAGKSNIENLALVLYDLNRASGSILELRRIDPTSVFIKSPL